MVVAFEGKEIGVAVARFFVVSGSVVHAHQSPFATVGGVHECFSQHKQMKFDGCGRVVFCENDLNNDIKLVHKLRFTELFLCISGVLLLC